MTTKLQTINNYNNTREDEQSHENHGVLFSKTATHYNLEKTKNTKIKILAKEKYFKEKKTCKTRKKQN